MSEYLDARPFVVAWINCMDRTINQVQVNALHEWQALELALGNDVIFQTQEFHTITSMTDLIETATDRNFIFSVVEVV